MAKTTICSKHDWIASSAAKISLLAARIEGLDDAEEMRAIAEAIRDEAEDVSAVVAEAKSDGQRMEDALRRRKDEVADLNGENEELERKLRAAEATVADLEDQVRYLEEAVGKLESQAG